MKSINIVRNGQITNSASFETQELLDNWYSSHLAMGTFGKPGVYQDVEVLISPEVRGEVSVLQTEATFDEFGEELTPATYSIDSDGVITAAVYEIQNMEVTPSEFICEVSDTTEKDAQHAKNTESQEFLDSTDWLVIRAMERGEQLSIEIKEQRDAARLSIVR